MKTNIGSPRLLAALALTLCAIAARAEDIMARSASFNIAPQPLASALIAFASQSGVQVATAEADLSKLKSGGVNGTRPVGEALKLLLKGTSLKFGPAGTNTIAITSSRPAPAGTARAGNSAGVFSLARVDTGAGASSGRDEIAGDAPVGQDAKGIPELLVKGRRSVNADIERTEDDVQPYVVFTAEDIRESMAGDLSEFLMARLPMTTSPNGTSVPHIVNGGFAGNASEVNLRGLGSNQTLILVNGRRVAGVGNSGDFSQSDINGIAVSTIQRIEVLPSTAGGIYGGGATGGVINIILKNDFDALELRAVYDNTFESDAGRRRVEGNFGYTLEGGRTSVMLSGGYSETAMLTIGDRDFLQRARELMLENNPAAFYGGTSPPSGATANIRSATAQNLTLKAGNISLGSLYAHVPVGYAGPSSDNGLAFLGTANRYNLDIPRGPGGLGRSMNLSPETWSGRLNLRRNFTDSIEVFLDASMDGNRGLSRTNRLPMTVITLPSTAPNNPFVQNIRVQFPGSDFPTGTDMITELLRRSGTLGVVARLPHRWTLQADYGLSRSRRWQQYNTQVMRTTGTTGTTALANGTLDILRDVDAYPLDYSPYLLPVPNYFLGPFTMDLDSASGRAGGPVLSLPAGPVMVAALLETRQAALKRVVNLLYNTAGTPTYPFSAPRQQRTDSAYAEVTAPVISAKNAFALARALDLQVSYRYDRTTTSAVESLLTDLNTVPSPEGPFPDTRYKTNSVRGKQYKAGVRYQPADALALRASYAAGILPPSLSQLAPLEFGEFTVSGVDPKRKNEPVGLVESYSSSGNHNLLPEQSRSWSFGAILTPDAAPGLRLSVDYTRIRKRDEITSLSAQQVLDLDFQGLLQPGYITRAPLSAQEQADGYLAGRILTFADGQVNVARAAVDAFDFQIDYSWRTALGDFRLNAIATWQQHLERLVTNGAAVTDLVGFSDGPLEWRGNIGLNWKRHAWSAGWNAQYYDAQLVYASTSNQTTIDSALLGQGSAIMPHQIYHDAFLRYAFDRNAATARGWLANSEFMVGVRNVFDRSPPILATTSLTLGGYSRYGDPLGRRYSLSLTKRFE